MTDIHGSTAVISGMGACLPPRIVSNEEVASRGALDTSDNWIRTRTGIARRRQADSGTSTGDLAVAAGRGALAGAAARPGARPGTRSLLTAFGGGLTWGSVALRWPRATPRVLAPEPHTTDTSLTYRSKQCKLSTTTS
ncbi:3-oxoacyl-[acyl-carrier-protein] synthase III C-terminal domain-containing protein [Streptomyces sp. NPDC048484]|uniref:3-oxoacyl-[acyl-carrier-protein] synthase III C-terminal domain-containing protein n=1 Tax=Streptomyces sp. NPDC048484 TaxID=3155146 RepID=UPI00342760C2